MFSPWIGCKPYSRGCKNCFIQKPLKYLGKLDSKTSLKKTQNHERLLDYKVYPKGTGCFVCPLSDFLLPETDEWREEIWPLFKARPDMHFYIQTKRVIRFLEPGILPKDWENGYDNVFINATIDDPNSSEERLNALVEIPAKRKIIALTPLTSPMNVETALKTGKVQQGYTIGEKGDDKLKVRPLKWEWVKDLHDQFLKWETHFDFKAAGSFWIDENRTEYHLSMIKQFKVAQEANLGVVGKGDYDVVIGVNHEHHIDDWRTDPMAQCVSERGQIFY
jgi:protein gp37